METGEEEEEAGKRERGGKKKKRGAGRRERLLVLGPLGDWFAVPGGGMSPHCLALAVCRNPLFHAQTCVRRSARTTHTSLRLSSG